MKVLVSKYAGFCPGVKRAVGLALNHANQGERISTWGPLVHNRETVDYLKEHGVDSTERLENAHETILIRSHGISPMVRAELHESGKQIVDATCGYVLRIHRLVEQLSQKGYWLVIVGDPLHPEIVGITGWSGSRYSIVANLQEAELLLVPEPIAVVVQTTFSADDFQQIATALENKYPDIRIHNTICPATRERQAEIADLAAQVNLMLVIGGKHSANTKKLINICQETGVKTHHIESTADIQTLWFQDCFRVGIAAGASTPEWIIREVVEMVEEFKNDGLEEREAAVDSLDQETRPLGVGDIVVGKVVQVNPDEILVDVGYKLEGLIRRDELSFRKVDNCAELVQAGDQIEAEVICSSDDLLELSVRKLAQHKAWKGVKDAFENQTPVSGKVVEVVKGGLIVDLGLRGFMPASLVDLRFVEDLSQFMGQEVTVMVIELEKRRNKVIVSRKAWLQQQSEVEKKVTLEKLQEGSTVKGVVRRLTGFGAFVDLGGIDGLIHVSEVAHHRVEDPSEVLHEGQEVEVFVLKVDANDERISLSLKKTQPDPWTQVGQKFRPGDVLEGKVVRLAGFGAFVELVPGVDGLVHVSQISEDHVEKPEDALSVGQVVKVKIRDIDTQNKRVSLSIRDGSLTPKVRTPREDSKPKEQVNSYSATIGERLGNLFDSKDE